MKGAQLPEDEAAKTAEEQHEECLHPPEWVLEPVPFLPLADHDFPARHRQREETEANIVEGERLPAQLCPLRPQIRRILDNEVAHHQGQTTDGEIDIEDPAPFVKDSKVAAERGANNGRQQGRDAKDRLSGPL